MAQSLHGARAVAMVAPGKHVWRAARGGGVDVKGDIEACLAPNGGEKMRAQQAVRGGGREKRETQEGEGNQDGGPGFGPVWGRGGEAG